MAAARPPMLESLQRRLAPAMKQTKATAVPAVNGEGGGWSMVEKAAERPPPLPPTVATPTANAGYSAVTDTTLALDKRTRSTTNNSMVRSQSSGRREPLGLGAGELKREEQCEPRELLATHSLS